MIIFNLIIIILAIVAFYYINLGRKYENDASKDVLAFVCLGLFFLVVKSLVKIFVSLGVATFLFSNISILIYEFLFALSFLMAIFKFRKLK
ncbi:MAG: hypothetical protein U9Q69_02875 [Nanoarchaeota archaeon]|nr:hypothetical protein [Nanoarchaeota archaeon]